MDDGKERVLKKEATQESEFEWPDSDVGSESANDQREEDGKPKRKSRSRTRSSSRRRSKSRSRSCGSKPLATTVASAAHTTDGDNVVHQVTDLLTDRLYESRSGRSVQEICDTESELMTGDRQQFEPIPVVYVGPVDERGVRCGIGQISAKDRFLFAGQLEKGLPNGLGRMVFAMPADVLARERQRMSTAKIVADKPIAPATTAPEGEAKYGIADRVHAVYEGQFMQGWFHGHGVFTDHVSGAKFEGEFRGGRVWGNGLLTPSRQRRHKVGNNDEAASREGDEGYFEDVK